MAVTYMSHVLVYMQHTIPSVARCGAVEWLVQHHCATTYG